MEGPSAPVSTIRISATISTIRVPAPDHWYEKHRGPPIEARRQFCVTADTTGVGPGPAIRKKERRPTRVSLIVSETNVTHCAATISQWRGAESSRITKFEMITTMARRDHAYRGRGSNKITETRNIGPVHEHNLTMADENAASDDEDEADEVTGTKHQYVPHKRFGRRNNYPDLIKRHLMNNL